MVKKFLSIVATLLALSSIAQAAAIIGTENNDFLFFEGATGTFNQTITNAYSGQTIAINEEKYINTATYDGLGSEFDILFMSDLGDVLTIRDASNNQTVQNIEIFIAGDGNDVINLSDQSIILGDMIVDGGAGHDIIWGNVGNDLIRGREGNDIIHGGAGNDLIFGDAENGNDIPVSDDDSFTFLLGDGLDTIYGGGLTNDIGFDEIIFGAGISLLDLTLSTSNGFDVIDIAGGDQIVATGIEQLRFDDNSTYVIPEPSVVALVGIFGGGLWFIRRYFPGA